MNILGLKWISDKMLTTYDTQINFVSNHAPTISLYCFLLNVEQFYCIIFQTSPLPNKNIHNQETSVLC